MSRIAALLMGLWGLLLIACDRDEAEAPCTAGAVSSCTCGGLPGTRTCNDAGVQGPCKCDVCEGETSAAICERLGLECGAVDTIDNCGARRTAQCGRCEDGEACGVIAPNRCDPTACLPESDATLCARLGKECDAVAATDNCGDERTVDCGDCKAPEVCGAVAANECDPRPCIPESDDALCDRTGAECDRIATTDGCGHARDVDCGTCMGGAICGALTAHVCDAPPCVPESDLALCARQGAECGTVTAPDNCGAERTAECGACDAPEVCGAVALNACDVPPCEPESDDALCARLGAECGALAAIDNCGAPRSAACGGCSAGESCGAAIPNVCGCVAETDGAFCARFGAECGLVTGSDNCGAPRVAQCGECAAPESCGVTTPNVCSCNAETNAAFCDRLGKECGSVTANDNCGVRRTTSCGTCTAPEVCGAQAANVCGCVAESNTAFCGRLGKECGSVTANDNCGAPRTATCGSCTSPETCGALAANTCGCVAESNTAFCGRLGKNCGAVSARDNCGASRTASCGACSGGLTCGARTPNVCGCLAETNVAFCSRLGKNCGAVSGLDNCGTQRSTTCGTCTGGRTCGAETANVCGCLPESDATFCARYGKNCDVFSATDNCGAPRAAWCGSCTGGELCGVDLANVCAPPPCVPEPDVTFCARYDKDCGAFTATDNCGAGRTADCGGCGGSDLCGASTANVCGPCVPESDSRFCSQRGKNCGLFSSTDNCGDPRTVDCGDCAANAVCGLLTANVCTCVAESDATFCTRLGAECGSLTARDDCGRTRTVACGACPSGESCGLGAANQCVTTPLADNTPCDATLPDSCGFGKTCFYVPPDQQHGACKTPCNDDLDCGARTCMLLPDGGGLCGTPLARGATGCGDVLATDRFCANTATLPDQAFLFCMESTCELVCDYTSNAAGELACPAGETCGARAFSTEYQLEIATCCALGDPNCDACAPGASGCDGNDLRVCDDSGTEVTIPCAAACVPFTFGSYCEGDDTTAPHVSGTITFEARTANAALTDWGPLQTAPLATALVVSFVWDEAAQALVVLDHAHTADDGTYQVRVAASPHPNDRVVIALVDLDDAGNVDFAVADPVFTTTGEHDVYDVQEVAVQSRFWTYAVTSTSLAAGSDVHIPEASNSEMAAVYSQVHIVHDGTRALLGASGDSIVVWIQPDVTWSCGACAGNIPSRVGGVPFESAIWLGHDADQGYWSDAVTVHELGHWVMTSYGTPPGEGGPHFLGQRTLPGQAWSEGFATFFSSLARGREHYYDKQDDSFFWVDLREMAYVGGGPVPPASANATGYPNAADPILQMMEENLVAAMAYAIAADNWPPRCDDTCASARDAICDDGGPSAVTPDCAYGTDCADCGTREALPPRLADVGTLFLEALAAPRMNVTHLDPNAAFQRNYVRHTWDLDTSTYPPTIVNLQAISWWSSPMFADYVDALRCLSATAGADLDPLIADVIAAWPYPIIPDPICQ